MPDQFNEVTTTSYGAGIAQSFKNIFIGLILFVLSFVILFWNEGRYDLSLLAKKSVEINSSNVDQAKNGSLVALTGSVTTTENIGDNLFVKPANYLALNRTVETYAWVEKTQTKSTHNTGGSETDSTTYNYAKEWTDHPKSSENFKYREGHENATTTPLSNFSGRVNSATIGSFTFDMQSLALPSFETLSLTTDNTLSEQGGALANGQYIFLSKVGGTFDNPSLGDERISYSVLLPGFTGTIFGKQNDSRIESYRDKDDHLLFNLLRGGRDDAIASLHSEFVFWTWILRLTGFMMMWVGLGLLFGWIVTLANILPFFGSMTGFLVSFATLITAIVLSLTTIIVSMIVHSLIAVVVAVVISIMVLIFFARKMKNDTPAQIPPSDSQPIQSVPSIMPVTPIVPTV